MPLVFCFMENKDFSSYIELFEELKLKCKVFKVKNIVFDFEIA
jgi:hypothetical protein